MSDTAGTKPRLTDPLEVARHRLGTARAVSVIVLLVAGVWAFWPLSVAKVEAEDVVPRRSTLPESAESPAASIASLPELDIESFNAPLWTVAQPPPPPAAAPPLPPMKLQLLGIDSLQEDGAVVYRAVLYDPDQDKVLVLRSGDTIGPRVIRHVDRRSVTLALANAGDGRSPAGDQVLSLHPGDTPAAPSGGRNRP